MSEHELEKLLGGFAADTLTPEERQKLFTAALQDQQLFNALADEQALKELLTDPAVRGRLLETLNRSTSPSGISDSLSWLDWLRRPATFTYAGGLTVAALAIVLGTKVYQESLRQISPSATEDVRPVDSAPTASQPAQAPLKDTEPKEKTRVAPTAPASTPPSPEQRLSSSAKNDLRLRSPDQADAKKQAPVTAPGKSAEDAAASAGKQEANAPPPAAAPEPAMMQEYAPATGAGAASARALFYAEVSPRPEIGMLAQERETRESSAKPAPEATRPERKTEPFALKGKAADVSVALRPLGLRYSFIVQEADGRDREVDALTVKQNLGQAYMIVEANQDAYLQIWKQVGAAMPQLLFPQKDTGQISLRIAAGQRQRVPLPTEREPIIIRLSRVPFGPVSRQEAIMLGRIPSTQIHETITTRTPTGRQEQATYIVNQDASSTAQIAVEVQFDR